MIPTSRDPVRAAVIVLAILTLFSIVAYAPHLELFAYGMLRSDLLQIVADRDFANYWMAGRMVLDGQQLDLFNHEIYFARLQMQFGSGYSPHNWGYPPHFLLVLWPLGFLGYRAALSVFLLVTFALFVVAALIFRRSHAPHSNRTVLVLAILGYALVMIDATQNGFLLSAVMLCALSWRERAPLLSGLCFAVLTVKPQLGVLVPVLLLFERNWRVIGWTLFFTVLLVALSLVFFGTESWNAYLVQAVEYQRTSVLNDWSGIFFRMMPTAFGSMRTLGASTTTAYLVQVPVSIAAFAACCHVLSRDADPQRRVFALLCASFLVAPYAFNYDMGALVVSAAVLAGSRVLHNRSGIIAVSLTAGLASVVMNLGRSSMPIAPLILAAALAAIIAETRQRSCKMPNPVGLNSG